MGLHKGKEVFSKKSSTKKKLKQIREEIIKENGADSDYRPVVGIDVSICLCFVEAALTGITYEKHIPLCHTKQNLLQEEQRLAAIIIGHRSTT